MLDRLRTNVLDTINRIFAELEEPDLTESRELTDEYVDLTERAVRRDGSIPIKLIRPGWGSSGYYPADVLRRDGPSVFRAGTHMYWNHQTITEEMERPEGDLSNLAAVLLSDARYDENGADGPGLYADAKIFEQYQPAVGELAPHIGVSIRARGKAADGEAENRKGRIIQSIDEGRSVDFVTKPGAGGRILELFESARMAPASPAQENAMQEQEQIVEEAAVDVTLQQRVQELETENGRLREALLLREAAELIRNQLGASGLPTITQQRLQEQLVTGLPMAGQDLDSAALTERVTSVIAAESQYLASVMGNVGQQIVGLGVSVQDGPDGAQISARMAESFRRMGFDEATAQIAAAGRK